MKHKSEIFELVGHTNPMASYPSPVVPVGYYDTHFSVIYADDEEPDITIVKKEDIEVVEYKNDLKARLKNFDFIKERLFAFTESKVTQYLASEEGEFFSKLLTKEAFSKENVFFRFMLAKATGQEEIIIKEIEKCVEHIKKKSEGFLDSWLEQEKELLARLGIERSELRGTLRKEAFPTSLVSSFGHFAKGHSRQIVNPVSVTMKELLEAGVHFGHQVRRWNPKMKEYIFGERNGIYIIDLQKTQKLFRDALAYVQEAVTERPKMKILFVGTKRQAQETIKEEAERCGQFYINNRWLGGLMTNFQTVQKSVKKMRDIEAMKEDGRFEMLTKKERLELDREHEGLMKNIGGIRDMNGLPDMLFVIDVRKEDIAVSEANRLGIPVVAVVDTNCSPEGISAVIPGNDDALRAIRLFASRIADAILEGQQVIGDVIAKNQTFQEQNTNNQSYTTVASKEGWEAKKGYIESRAGEAQVYTRDNISDSYQGEDQYEDEREVANEASAH